MSKLEEINLTKIDRDQLYRLTRNELLQEFQEVIENYIKAKRRAGSVIMAIRSLSYLTNQEIPSHVKFPDTNPNKR